MTTSKKLLCLILASIFAVSLAACGKGGGVDTKDTGETEEAFDLGDLDYKGATFTIHSSTNSDLESYTSSNYLIQGADEIVGDKASDSALQRNKKVEQDLNIKLNFIEATFDYTDVVPGIREFIKAGADDVQLIINDMFCLQLTPEGLFYDALYGKYFDFSQNWWYDGLMESASLNSNTRYMLAGDFFIDVTRHTHCLLMNKDYYTEIGCDPDSVYQMVRDGKWTLDSLYTIVKGGEDGTHSTYQDVQGNHKRDRRDRWGLVLCQWWGPMIPFLVTSDPGYISRDEKGYPEITVNNPRSVDMCEKLTALLNAEETAVGIHNSNQDCIDSFVEGNVLFLTYQRLGSLESEIFANADLNFAILPYPKLDEMQENYISTVHDTTEMGFIPVTLAFKDLEFVSAVVEYLSRETAEVVMPKYYESTLKIRYARESANAEMIQLIHDSYGNTFPIAWAFPGDVNIMTYSFYDAISKNVSTFASYYRAYENSAKTALANTIAAYEEVREEFEAQIRK